MFHLKAWLPFCCACAPIAAQASSWTWHELPNANATVLAVRFDHGFDGDADAEHGVARVLAECRLERARAAAPGAKASGVQVFPDATVWFVLVDAAATEAAATFVGAVLDESLPLHDDTIALAIARAALLADDAAWLYPGQVLAGRARAALLAGTAAARGVAGTASAVQQLTGARVRELLRRPVTGQATGIGALPAALRERAAALPLAASSAASLPAPPPTPALPAACEFAPHVRIDAPFAAVAGLAPSRDLLPAFAVGLEVARLRGARSMKPRGEEVLGRAPLVGWSWLAGDPLVLFCRRAKNGSSGASAQAELATFLQDLRHKPPTDAEVAAAQRALQGELALPPWPAPLQAVLARTPSGLPGRAMVVLLAERRGIDGAAIAGVTAAAAHRALASVLAAPALFAGGLAPTGVDPTQAGTSR